MVLSVLVAVTLTGCDSGGPADLPEPTQSTIVDVQRGNPAIRTAKNHVSVKFACGSAKLDYNGRTVVLKGVSQLGGTEGYGWIGGIRIEGNDLVLVIPPDAEYVIFIGNQKHVLQKLVAEK